MFKIVNPNGNILFIDEGAVEVIACDRIGRRDKKVVFIYMKSGNHFEAPGESEGIEELLEALDEESEPATIPPPPLTRPYNLSNRY